jgi:hypothetical protein
LPVKEVQNSQSITISQAQTVTRTIGQIQNIQTGIADQAQNTPSTTSNQAQSKQSTNVNQTETQSTTINQAQNIPNGVIAFCVEPWNLTVEEGDVFNVSVAVENIPANPGLTAAEFHLSWDPTVLNGLSFIKVMFQDNSIGWDDLNSTEGVLFYVHALCSGSISGNQTLAIITFEAIGQGSSLLHFTFAAACSPDALKLDCETVDGSVAVEGGSGASLPIVSNGPTNLLYTMSIVAGSVIDNNTLTLPPAIAVKDVPFSVNIEIVNVSNMAGWEFGLNWNNSVLNCTSVEIYNPSSWQTALSIDGMIDNNFTSTDGRYHVAFADANDPYSGTITIATLTFNPIGTGTTPLTFDHACMVDANCCTLKFSTTIGSITVNDNASS